MSVIVLPLAPDARARARLHHLLEGGDVIGGDDAGRTVIQLTVSDWLLEQLLTFDASSEDLEENGDDEPDEGPVTLSFDRMPSPKWTSARASASTSP